ncbi:dTDP-3,4-didehydro-2,6-dideoxy-alpha-D-glucose 3-reductase [Paraconexibacter sp. AEG42_29]|uniref:dTDP-3,4-didehydro-2,6-dideoxy-alpha-D-glucose 3-reductase n=1 Tax=Paraconexibacter sp. AEG42_29 TaxID=2997339 RepID=A0AAU7AVE7_9ACTN
MTPLRVGLLSTARINHKLVEGARQAADVEVVAVGSRSRERAAAHASELGFEGVRVHASYDDVLADPDVDAVYVALPNGDHVAWSIRALEAGKHVLCEKPLSRRAADVARAFDVAEREGRVLAEAFMWRHHPQVTRLQELIADGVIGEVRSVRAAFSFSLGRTGDVRLSAALDGGALMDVGCYCVSGTRLVLGEPELVGGTQVLGGDGVDVRFAAWLRFPGDRTATIDCAFDLPARDELEIIGSAGTLFLDDPWHARRPVIDVRRGEDVDHVEVPSADPYACELTDLAAAVRGERAPLLGRADAEGQARVIEALYRSAAEGRAVAP